MVRRKPELASLIAAEEFRYIRPSTWGPTTVNATTANEVLTEATRAVDNCPTSSFGYFYKLRAEFALGNYDEAIATGQTLIDLAPRNAQVYAFLGPIYEATNRQTDAIRMYEKALVINPKLNGARKNLRRLRGF